MTHDESFVCALPVEEVGDRAAQGRALARELIRTERRPQQVVLDFAPAAEAQVHEFVRDESRCCPFFGFRVDVGATRVRLQIEAPAGAEPFLDVLTDRFEAWGRPAA